MAAQPARVAAAATPERLTHAPEHPEQAVEALSQLVAFGRPLSQLIDEAKSLATKLAVPMRTGGIDGEVPPSATEHLREPPVDTRNRENNPDIVDKLRAAIAARVEQEKRIFRLPPLVRRLSVWLSVAISLAVLAHLALMNMPKPTAVNSAVPATSLITSQAEQAPAIAAPPVTAKPVEQAPAIAPPSLIAKPAGRPYEKIAPSNPEPPKAAAIQGGRNVAEQHLSVEEIAGLVARGDALVSKADIVSGRLVYERAAAAGNAEAALRLGVSYDPSFLSRAGVKGTRGDPGLAAYWYKRARALGAGGGQPETLLKNVKPRQSRSSFGP